MMPSLQGNVSKKNAHYFNATFTLVENAPKITNRLLFCRNSGALFTHNRSGIFGKMNCNWACSLCAEFLKLSANQEAVGITAAEIIKDIQHLFEYYELS